MYSSVLPATLLIAASLARAFPVSGSSMAAGGPIQPSHFPSRAVGFAASLLPPVASPSASASDDASAVTSPENRARSVPFQPCGSPNATHGVVKMVTVEPCHPGSNDDCEFRFNQNYTISIDYAPLSGAFRPRSSLVARDDSTSPPTTYAYSGQSFNACTYTACPIKKNRQATYTYLFRALKSRFDSLEFSVTTWVDGPLLFCASIDVGLAPT